MQKHFQIDIETNIGNNSLAHQLEQNNTVRYWMNLNMPQLPPHHVIDQFRILIQNDHGSINSKNFASSKEDSLINDCRYCSFFFNQMVAIDFSFIFSLNMTVDFLADVSHWKDIHYSFEYQPGFEYQLIKKEKWVGNQSIEYTTYQLILKNPNFNFLNANKSFSPLANHIQI